MFRVEAAGYPVILTVHDENLVRAGRLAAGLERTTFRRTHVSVADMGQRIARVSGRMGRYAMSNKLTELQQKVFDLLDAKPNTDVALADLYSTVYGDGQSDLFPPTNRDMQQKMGPLRTYQRQAQAWPYRAGAD